MKQARVLMTTALVVPLLALAVGLTTSGAASASSTSTPTGTRAPMAPVTPGPSHPAGASAAPGNPRSGESCINTLTIDPPEICFEINGLSSYVNWFWVSVGSGYAVGRFHVAGPDGKSWWTGAINVEGGKGVYVPSTGIYSYEPPGPYCGSYWNENPNGTFTWKGRACVTVLT